MAVSDEATKFYDAKSKVHPQDSGYDFHHQFQQLVYMSGNSISFSMHEEVEALIASHPEDTQVVIRSILREIFGGQIQPVAPAMPERVWLGRKQKNYFYLHGTQSAEWFQECVELNVRLRLKVLAEHKRLAKPYWMRSSQILLGMGNSTLRHINKGFDAQWRAC